MKTLINFITESKKYEYDSVEKLKGWFDSLSKEEQETYYELYDSLDCKEDHGKRKLYLADVTDAEDKDYIKSLIKKYHMKGGMNELSLILALPKKGWDIGTNDKPEITKVLLVNDSSNTMILPSEAKKICDMFKYGGGIWRYVKSEYWNDNK